MCGNILGMLSPRS